MPLFPSASDPAQMAEPLSSETTKKDLERLLSLSRILYFGLESDAGNK